MWVYLECNSLSILPSKRVGTESFHAGAGAPVCVFRTPNLECSACDYDRMAQLQVLHPLAAASRTRCGKERRTWEILTSYGVIHTNDRKKHPPFQGRIVKTQSSVFNLQMERFGGCEGSCLLRKKPESQALWEKKTHEELILKEIGNHT